MKIRHKVTGEIIEKTLRLSMGWWQFDAPYKPSISYDMQEWEEVKEEQSGAGQ